MTIIEKAKERNEFDRLEDGFLYYFPSGKGGLSMENLLEIAAYLKEENKEIQKSIDDYFKTAPEYDGGWDFE